MDRQHSQAPATNNQPNNGTALDSTQYFPRPIVPGMMPPVAPQTVQPGIGGRPQGIPFYPYWNPSPAAYPQQPNASVTAPELKNNTAHSQNQSGNTNSSHKRCASTFVRQEATSDPDQDEDNLNTFMPRVRRHLRQLNGSQLREIILSVCLNSSTVYKHVVCCVKQKEANQKVVIDNGSEGLGLHLQYFRIGELEGLITHICEHESTATRRTIKYLILSIEEQKELDRDKKF
ncbi:hypothetical protein F4776DRAFT_658977 [Hypoxylon sp. NC0597]|nr:hypothetical protein F4776DRAFT_658977 [Hypoxylon sp. NC0597]